MLHPNSKDVSSYLINMESSSFENLSAIETKIDAKIDTKIDAKIESKIQEVHERFMEDILNKIDEKFENETKKNNYLFSQINKKCKKLEEETKKINEKMNNHDKRSEILRDLNEVTIFDLRKLHRDNIGQGKFNQHIASKVSMIEESNKYFYGKIENLFGNFEKMINIKFESLSNKFDRIENLISRSKDSLELSFCVNKSETDKKFEYLFSLQQKNEIRLDSLSDRVLTNEQKSLRFEKTFDSISDVIKTSR